VNAVHLQSPAVRTLVLDAGEAAAVDDVARQVAWTDALVDSPGWVEAARDAWDELPLRLRREVRRFRRAPGEHGTLLVQNLPIDTAALPRTPSSAEAVQRVPTPVAAVLTMVATGLGDPGAFEREKSGCLVQDVVPVPGKEEFQGNAGSVDLSFHVENAFHPHRPDFVLLVCLRRDHEGRAALRTASIRAVAPCLSAETREALRRPEFQTVQPPSFGPAANAERHAVLVGAPDDADVRVDLNATKPLTPDAEAALRELAELFNRYARNTYLDPGDLAIVDNRVTVHGRTAFRPRYNGHDRWLQRTFAFADLRASRAHRPVDGYVLR
jgi:L-asparagine oxygenase